MKERSSHLSDELRSAEAVIAYHILETAGLKGGMQLRYTSPPVSSVDFFDKTGAWLHSFTINRGHLLFYIRKPAIEKSEGLLSKAASLFNVVENKAGEGKIRIESSRDAMAVAAWFF